MFTDSLLTYIRVGTTFLLEHRDFFSIKEKIDLDSLPAAMKDYFSKATEKDFLENMEELTHKLQTHELHKIHENGLYLAFLKDAVETVNSILDEKETTGELAKIIKQLSVYKSEQELQQALYTYMSAYTTTPFIVVQSPLPLLITQKQDIRAFFSKKYELSVPFFRVDPLLIGGIRIFVDGNSYEWSYRANLTQILSTLYSHVES